MGESPLTADSLVRQPCHHPDDSRQEKSSLWQGDTHTAVAYVHPLGAAVPSAGISRGENKVNTYSCVTLEIILNLSETPFFLFAVSSIQ